MTISGNIGDYLFVFAGGVFLSFTPCVYPLIPITASFIGINAGGSHLKGMLLSFVYVTGVAVTYSALGLIASLSGSLFGKVSAHPVTQLIMGLVIIVFGLSMLNVFAIYFPTINKLAHFHRKGYRSIFLLGLTSGLAISPCVAPALGAILVYLSTTGNVFYGATLLLTFAYGMGLTLILVGTYSTILLHFPRSGKWMMWIERICASVLLGMGVYFVYNALTRIVRA